MTDAALLLCFFLFFFYIVRPRKVFLPPIGGLTIYIFGDPALIPDEDVQLTVRVHDECNGSDVFGRYVYVCVCVCVCLRRLEQVALHYGVKLFGEGESGYVGTGLVVFAHVRVYLSILFSAFVLSKGPRRHDAS